MELHINQFWVLKVHSTINSANEHGPDVLNAFCAMPVKKLKILQRTYEFISVFATQKDNISLNITPKEIKLSPCIKFHYSFSSLESIYTKQVFFCAQSRMQMSKNVNNDVSMNPPIERSIKDMRNWVELAIESVF